MAARNTPKDIQIFTAIAVKVVNQAENADISMKIIRPCMGLAAGGQILFSVSQLVIVVVYTVILLRVLPEKQVLHDKK